MGYTGRNCPYQYPCTGKGSFVALGAFGAA